MINKGKNKMDNNKIAEELLKLANQMISGNMPSDARFNEWLSDLNLNTLRSNPDLAVEATKDIIHDAWMETDTDYFPEMVDAIRIMVDEFPEVDNEVSNDLKKLEKYLKEKFVLDSKRTELVESFISELDRFSKDGWSDPEEINESIGWLNLKATIDTTIGKAEYTIKISKEEKKPEIKIFGSMSLSRDTEAGSYLSETDVNISKMRKSSEVVEQVSDVKKAKKVAKKMF